ncbi:MAG TPA: ShlB/FhaC/HecB family hemolysin secretion/activation protein [Hyphomicrobiales bacterium]|nr:ShlB/FhaC/HecB family hemolysin secretion/activation protein [Hyphomicrobiales bacterium]
MALKHKPNGVMDRVIGLSIGMAVALSVGSAASPAFAQATDRYKPQVVEKSGLPVRITPRSEAQPITDETVLIGDLKGLVITDDAEALRTTASASGVDVRATGEAVPAGVAAAAGAFIGKPVSLASLDQLTRAMVLAYRAAGMPVVNVVVPEQDITNGVVQVIAVVGRLGQMSVTGETDNPEFYTKNFRTRPGEIIANGKVLEDLRYMNRRFWRRVDAVYAAGQSFSLTDIELQALESKPWNVFAGIDNTGNDTTGEYHLYAGAQIGNLWGLDHEFAFQLTTTDHGDDLVAGVGTYTLPVYGRTDLQLLGAYVSSQADLAPLNLEGTSWQFGAAFTTPLPRVMEWSSDLRYGVEIKSSDNDLEFGGIAAFNTETRIAQGFVQLVSQRQWSFGTTRLQAGLWMSPGDVLDDNDDAAFATARAGTSAQYAYFRGGVEQSVMLPLDFRFAVNVDGQYSGERLLPSEMMYLGGMQTVRGFAENAVRGDSGIVGNFALYSPGVSLLGDTAKAVFDDKDTLRAYAFFDVGAIDVVSPLPGEIDAATLGGAGLGLNWQFGSNLSADVAYGWQAIENGINDTDDGRLHFSVRARF